MILEDCPGIQIYRKWKVTYFKVILQSNVFLEVSLTHLWKYSTQLSATPSCTLPIVWITCCFTCSLHSISNDDKKWSATATSASLGQRWNQSMVQPEMSPGNLRARLRNFSPTWFRHANGSVDELHVRHMEVDGMVTLVEV